MGIIAKAAIEEFLSRPMRDSSKGKKFTLRALQAKLRKEGVETVTDPYWHQLLCILLGIKRQSYLFLLGMGGGKTKICLDLHRYHGGRHIVLVPYGSNIGAWQEEMELHAPDLTFVGLTGNGHEERMAQVMSVPEEGGVLVATYAGWVRLVSTLKSVDVREGQKSRNKQAINHRLLEKLCAMFEQVTFDECTMIRGSGVFFRVANKMARCIPHRYALTGTPFDGRVDDLWSQFYVIDLGHTLGSTKGLFRAAFFTESKGYFGGYEYTLKRGAEEKIHRRLRHCSIRFKEEECQDLPDSVGGVDSDHYHLLPVIMPKENWRYYEQFQKQMIEAKGNREQIENAYLGMRKLASGWMTMTDEDGNKSEIVFPNNPKLDALGDWLEDVPKDEKVVVAVYYKVTARIVADFLKSHKVNHRVIVGGSQGKGATDLHDWKKRKGVRVLVGSTAIAYGLNLQVARRMFLFESPDTLILRRQLERRILRNGQRRRCYFTDCIVKGSVEQRILDGLKSNKTVVDAVVDGKLKPTAFRPAK